MRILIAEDETVSRRLLEHQLHAMGHEVVSTADGEEAWKAFCKEPFPVVITDWRMPVADGLELTRRIRASRTRFYPWIIMLTAMDFGENFRRTMEEGVDDFLNKPVDPELLAVRIAVGGRIQRMGEQVAVLTSALPICMHCKAVRDSGDSWKRVEEYFREIDFSHSFCPECYYEHSLLPELLRMRASQAGPEPDAHAALDAAVVAALRAFEDADSPGLYDDLCDGLRDAAPAVRADLEVFARAGLFSDESNARLQRFRNRCADIGAGRMTSLLDRLAALDPAELLARHETLAGELLAALDETVAAVEDSRAASTP